MGADFWDGPGGLRWVSAQRQMDGALAPFADAIFDAACIADGDFVVDVGCGCGTTTLKAARLAGSGRCAGVDISTSMLEVARRDAKTSGLDIDFHRADAASFSFDPGSVDVVVSRFGTMFFEEPSAAFANFRRWIGSDGRLVTVVWNRIEENAWMRSLAAVIRRHVELPRPLPGAPGPFAFGDAEAFESMLHRVGFANVEQTNLDSPMRIAGTRDDAIRFYEQRGPVASALEEIGEGPVGTALLADLEALVDEHYDGQALVLGASARLVVAR